MQPQLAAYAPDDLKGVLDLLSAAMPADPISESRFIRQVLLDQNFRSEGAIVAKFKHQVIGFCLATARQVQLENAPLDSDRGYITLMAVDPRFQRQGAGTKMLERAEDFLRSQQRKRVMIAPYAPGYFICGVDVEAYASGLQFFLTRGFRERYRPLAMQIDLWNFSVPDWVLQKRGELEAAGIAIESYRPQLTKPILDFAANEFAGDWVRVYRETMGRIALGEAASKIVIAHQNYSVLGLSHHDNERFGPIGVASHQRGKGIGHVLMYQTLDAQRLAGFRSAWFLWSDDATAARLYTAAGFREIRRFAMLEKDLSPVI